MAEQTIIPPDMDDILVEIKNEIFATMNCIQIGKIEKVNSNQTCEISIQFKRRINGDQIADYPLLVDCPYVVLSGGGSYIDMPIKAGDFCLVLFSDRNIDEWWSTANIKEPQDRRKHSLSDGIALVGINPETTALENDGTFVRILGTSGPGQEEQVLKGETFNSDLNTFLQAVITGTSTVGTSAQNAAALTAINAAAQTFLATLPSHLSTEVKSS